MTQARGLAANNLNNLTISLVDCSHCRSKFANNSSGRKITLVNSVESSKEIAPRLSHSDMAASLTLLNRGAITLRQCNLKARSFSGIGRHPAGEPKAALRCTKAG